MIEVRGLVKRYGAMMAVDELDLTLQDGEILTLLGPSGCGKTTTLRCIAGLETPDGGTISMDGRQLYGPGTAVPAHQRRMGMVFQNYAVWPHMTVFKNVAFPLKVQRMPEREKEERVGQILELTGLASLGGRYPSELSGGQQQRVALARALVSDPSVILYDEPLSNLDAKLRNEMRFQLRLLHDSLGTAAIYVTHDQQEAMVIADRVCLMDDGRIVQQGSARELYETPANLFASNFLGAENILEVESVNRTSHTATLPSGLKLRVSPTSPYWSEESDPDTKPWLSIRAHHIQLQSAGKGDEHVGDLFRGAIGEVAYLGDRIRYSLRVDGVGPLVVDDTRSSDLNEADQEVSVILPARRCVLIKG